MTIKWLNQGIKLEALGLLCVLTLGACSDRSEVTAPRPSAKAKPTRDLIISDPAVSLLSVELSGGELPQTMLYDLPVSGAASAQSLSIPAGGGYAATVRGYDRYGNLTHQGNTALERVVLGVNDRLDLVLEPVREGEPIKVSMDLVGEAPVDPGFRLLIRPSRRSIADGETMSLQAFVYDALGNQVPVAPNDIHWAVADPRTGFVLPNLTKEAPMASYTGRYLWDMNYAILIAEFRNIQTSIKQLLTADPWVDVSAGGNVTCAVRQLGRLYCWGNNGFAMLGTSQDSACTGYNDRCTSAPVLVQGGHKFSKVSVSSTHVCALEYFTSVPFCWGQNLFGEVGVATVANIGVPTQVSGNPPAYMSISAGSLHSCGVTAAGAAMCWGYNANSQLGNPSSGSTPTPTPVAAPAGLAQLTYSSVSAGPAFSCAITQPTSRVFCWGLLAGMTSSLPVEKVTATMQPWASLSQSTTAWHVCGTTNMNVAWCWGDNTDGQLGNGSGGAGFKSSAPVGVVTSAAVPFVSTAAGEFHSCALSLAGDAFCWGEDINGELGDGSQIQKLTPVQVLAGGIKFSTISVGSGYSCAIESSGNDIDCWGANSWGQLGLGTRNTPLPFGYANGVTFPTRIVLPVP